MPSPSWSMATSTISEPLMNWSRAIRLSAVWRLRPTIRGPTSKSLSRNLLPSAARPEQNRRTWRRNDRPTGMRSVSSSGPALAQSPAALPGTASPLAHAGELERLFVIVPDRLSALVSKGEVTQRYYNPGNLFRVVHLFMTNDD